MMILVVPSYTGAVSPTSPWPALPTRTLPPVPQCMAPEYHCRQQRRVPSILHQGCYLWLVCLGVRSSTPCSSCSIGVTGSSMECVSVLCVDRTSNNSYCSCVMVVIRTYCNNTIMIEIGVHTVMNPIDRVNYHHVYIQEII